MDGTDEVIYSESMRIESKVYYVDLRANARGQYLRLSETSQRRPRSAVLLPGAGVSWACALFDWYLWQCSEGHEPEDQDMAVGGKVFHFVAGVNERGRFLRVTEAHGSGRRTLVVPWGPAGAGWAALRDCLRRVASYVEADLAQAQQLPPAQQPLPPGALPQQLQQLQQQQQTPPRQPHPQQQQQQQRQHQHQQHLQPATASVRPRASAESASGADPSGAPAARLGAAAGSGAPVVDCGSGERVFLSLVGASDERRLRITQATRSESTSISIPSRAVPQFHDAVGGCLESLRREGSAAREGATAGGPATAAPVGALDDASRGGSRAAGAALSAAAPADGSLRGG